MQFNASNAMLYLHFTVVCTILVKVSARQTRKASTPTPESKSILVLAMF